MNWGGFRGSSVLFLFFFCFCMVVTVSGFFFVSVWLLLCLFLFTLQIHSLKWSKSLGHRKPGNLEDRSFDQRTRTPNPPKKIPQKSKQRDHTLKRTICMNPKQKKTAGDYPMVFFLPNNPRKPRWSSARKRQGVSRRSLKRSRWAKRSWSS